MRRSPTAAIAPDEWFDAAREAPRATRVFELGDFFALLSRSRGLIIATMLITALLGGAFALLAGKRYGATAQVFVDTRGLKVLSNEVMQGNTAGGDSVLGDFESQLRIMTSGAVLRRVVETENLVKDSYFSPMPGPLGQLRALIFGAPPEQDRILAAQRVLERSLGVKRSERSFVADITVTTNDPEKSARLAQAVAEAYLETQQKVRQDLTQRLGTEIAARLQSLRGRLEEAERKLATYRSANNLVTSNGRLVSEQDITELNTQLQLARARTSRLRARLAQAQAGGGAATSDVLDSATIVQLRVRLAEASRQLAELQKNLGPLHPDIQAAQGRVAAAQAAIAAEVERRRAAMRTDLDEAVAAERALNAQLERLKKQSGDVNQALIGMRELERAVDSNRKVYEEFLVRARELTEQQDIIPSASRIITPATPNAQPAGLSLPAMIALGLFGGLPLGVGLALFRGRREIAGLSAQRRARTDDGATAYAAPRARNDAARTRSGAIPPQTLARIDRADLAPVVSALAARRVNEPSPGVLDMAERVENAVAAARKPVTLVADCASNGASADLALALAGCWAWNGVDALVADGDAERAELSRRAELFGSPGLFDNLYREVEQSIVWGKAGLPHIMASVDPASRRITAHTRRVVAQRIEDVAADVEHMLIDVGAASQNPLLETLAAQAGQAIVVVERSQTPRAAIEATLSALRAQGVSVVGLVEVTTAPTQRRRPLTRFTSLFGFG